MQASTVPDPVPLSHCLPIPVPHAPLSKVPVPPLVSSQCVSKCECMTGEYRHRGTHAWIGVGGEGGSMPEGEHWNERGQPSERERRSAGKVVQVCRRLVHSKSKGHAQSRRRNNAQNARSGKMLQERGCKGVCVCHVMLQPKCACRVYMSCHSTSTSKAQAGNI